MITHRRWLPMLLLLAACVAWAATPWVDLEKRFTAAQLHATGLDRLTPEQLALLNQLLRDDAHDAAAAAPAPVATVPAEGGEQRKSLFGYDEGVILTRVVGTLAGWEPGTEFTFANGQRWKVLKGHYTLHKPLENPEVKIVPGAAGRWFFRIDDDTPGARVYRID
ncbi:hypothetical protein AB4059_06165 [Lysobacter sp. 2RAF19]